MDTRVRTVRILVPSSCTLTSATRNTTDAGGVSRGPAAPPAYLFDEHSTFFFVVFVC